MKKKLAICLCMTILALTACGKVSNERVTTSQDDMTKEEAIEYAQQLFAENVGDAEDMDSLLNNMIADATDDFMGSGTSDLVKEENENVSASSDIQKEEDLQINVEKESTELYLEPTNTILAEIPEGYEKVGEFEKDNILLEYFNSSDGYSAMLKCTNGNPFDVNVDVEYRFKSADPMDPNYHVQNAGNHTYAANQVYYEYLGRPIVLGSCEDLNEGRDYWYLPDDEKVVDGLKFEIIEWNEDNSKLKYRITNNLDRNISFVELQWILFDEGNAVDIKTSRPVDRDERPLYPGESMIITENPYGAFNNAYKKLMVSHCYDADSSNQESTSNESNGEQKRVEYARIDSDYGSYLFAVTGVKIVSSADGEKVYQISWEYENIDFGAKDNSYVSLPADALVITDSDGYKVGARSTFQEGETLNQEGIPLYSGEKCKAYSVFSINNEDCEYLTIGIDARMDESTQKVYVEK